MIKSRVVYNKSEANQLFLKFVVRQGDFDNVLRVSDSAFLVSISLAPGDFIVEPVEDYSLPENKVVFYGQTNGQSYVIAAPDFDPNIITN